MSEQFPTLFSPLTLRHKTLKNRIIELGEVSLLKFFEEMHSKRELVTAFVAVLEIVRTESVKLLQPKTFGDIILRKVQT